MKRILLLMLTALTSVVAPGLRAEITVSDVEVFSGLPWKEVVICYTTTGVTNSTDVIRLMVTDKVAKKCHTVKTLSGGELTEGRHTIRWNGAPGGVKISSEDVLFSVTVVDSEGVQLWENGPYWAECNAGAKMSEDYGDYFSWGDSDGCYYFTYTRYIPFGEPEIISNWQTRDRNQIVSFDPENCSTYGMDNDDSHWHDAARKYLGAPWRMPTDAEWEALLSNCDTTRLTRNGVYGLLVKGKGTYALKSIFLPSAGYGIDSGLYRDGWIGVYWSSTPTSNNSNKAQDFIWTGGVEDPKVWSNDRCHGQSVRPLRGSAE